MSAVATQLHERMVQLTPVKHARRKCPSFWAVMNAQQTLKARTMMLYEHTDIATSSLDFEEFSFWDETGSKMEPLKSPFLTALAVFLQEHYNVFELQESLPYLLLWCEDGIPQPDQRPWSVAGAIAVWLNEDEQMPWDILIGDWGEMASLELEDSIAEDLQLFHMPKADTLLSLVTRHFPDAIAVSYVAHTVIVEFPPTDDVAWTEKIMKLPDGFSNAAVNLYYHNGPLAPAELRGVKPNPTSVANLIGDDSDYVESDGCCYPGVMLAAEDGNRSSAGVLVERAGEERLTVAFHCWEKEFSEKPEKLGNEDFFNVSQGTTRVGYVSERIEATDIGLAAPAKDITFNNRFLDIDGTAKVLLRSSDLRVGDEVLIDSYITGRQRLRCLGRRVVIGKSANLPGSGTYIELNQGLYATGVPEIHSHPNIRAGVCGSAVVRVQSEKKDVLERGEVVGFMHWSDLQSRNDATGKLLCFADTTDALLDAGWQIKRTVAGEEVIAEEPESEGYLPFTKRRSEDDADSSLKKKSRIETL